MIRDALKAVAVVVAGGLGLIGLVTVTAVTCLVTGVVPLDRAFDAVEYTQANAATYGLSWGAAGLGNAVRVAIPHAGRAIVHCVADAVTRKLSA